MKDRLADLLYRLTDYAEHPSGECAIRWCRECDCGLDELLAEVEAALVAAGHTPPPAPTPAQVHAWLVERAAGRPDVLAWLEEGNDAR